ncbi:MAG: hypothetical protein ACTSQI_20590 [Candidatus Helarchaeota archaeon]
MNVTNELGKYRKEELEVLTPLAKIDAGWKAFLYFERQLGILDKKAIKILTIDGIIIGLASTTIGTIEVFAITMAMIFFCIAVVFNILTGLACLPILRLKWASHLLDKEKLIEGSFEETMEEFYDKIRDLRNQKAKFLNVAIIFIITSIACFVLAIICNTFIF